jgi:hypothetical protein
MPSPDEEGAPLSEYIQLLSGLLDDAPRPWRNTSQKAPAMRTAVAENMMNMMAYYRPDRCRIGAPTE